MKKYQKRKRPPVKPRPVQSVAPVLNVAPLEVGRDSYDKSLIWTKITALAAVVACVISVVAQVSSDKVVALALKNFSQVADAGGQQAAESKRIAEATVKLALSAQLQADAALQQADSATKQAAMSVYQASTSARSATANERAIGIAVEQLQDQRLAEKKRFRPILVIKAVDFKGLDLFIDIENVGLVAVSNGRIQLDVQCIKTLKPCKNMKSSDRYIIDNSIDSITKNANLKIFNLYEITVPFSQNSEIQNELGRFERIIEDSPQRIIFEGFLEYGDIFNNKYSEKVCFIIEINNKKYFPRAISCISRNAIMPFVSGKDVYNVSGNE